MSEQNSEEERDSQNLLEEKKDFSCGTEEIIPTPEDIKEEIADSVNPPESGPLNTIDAVVTKYGKCLLIKKRLNRDFVFTEELSQEHIDDACVFEELSWKSENQICRYISRYSPTNVFNVNVEQTTLLTIEYVSNTYRIFSSSEIVSFSEVEHQALGVEEMYTKIRDYVQKKSPSIVVVPDVSIRNTLSL